MEKETTFKQHYYIAEPHFLVQRLIAYVNISFELEYNLHYAHCKCGDPMGLHTIVCHVNHNIIQLEDLRTY